MTQFTRIPFGRTGRQVCPIGISASYGLDQDGVQEAVDHGVNYLYWGSMRTKTFGRGLKQAIQRNREDLLIVLQTYMRGLASLQSWDLNRGLRALGLDYADVLLLGWFNAVPSRRLLDNAQRLKEAGKVRHLAISTHTRKLVPQLEELGLFDIYHVRYNAAHPGAEQDIFPYVDPVSGPGIVAFTATCWSKLLDPGRMPEGTQPLSATDAYRFCLSNPHVHSIATGPANREQLRAALKAMELGPLSEQEMAHARTVGKAVHSGLREGIV